ncbi:MAG TPA: tRNA uridine-5-carboxymethylaminomethyl(34) synthesis GTPase MnmE [Syntrophales bacterium]|nr:tRNA uridine-5-carboxymethylaminomethyl(34) synthesis GTPase MnmE [Syntrophales bacterium]
MEDTIAGIATPSGTAAIGIIRVSGPMCQEIASRIFRPSHATGVMTSHRLYHGDIVSPDTGRPIDEVLVSIMRKPHSYTGEDVLEINCHGSPFILESVLLEVIRAGSRLAEPGEFTRRAFLNNRLDLSQAEAVADTITAKTDRALEVAVSHLKGEFARKIEEIRSSIVNVLALLEASIDFSDDDVEAASPGTAAEAIQSAIDELNRLASTYREGKIYRDGISVVIAGKPNVGKSSLLNRLLGEKKAIVTTVPGTTRDLVEGMISIRGIPVILTDTAGIREPKDPIEEEGIRRVWERVSETDLVIVLIDGSECLTDDDMKIIDGCRPRNFFFVINKSDLPHLVDEKRLVSLAPDTDVPVWISAKEGLGISALKEAIYSHALSDAQCGESGHIVSNIRHKIAIERTSDLLSRAKETILQGLSPELSAFDVRQSLENLGEIAGKTVTDEVLDRIFSTFCIGK